MDSNNLIYISKKAFYQRLFWLFIIALFLLLFGTNCGGTVCKKDQDCPSDQNCSSGKCVPKTEKKSEQGGSVETITSEKSKDVKELTPEQPQKDAGSKPPAYPDLHWKDSSATPPENLTESQSSKTSGLRKLGETCNPAFGAKAEDKCQKALLCVSADLNEIGICLKSCNPQKNQCTKNQICGPVLARENLNRIGYACGKKINNGYPCTFGAYCQKGDRCVPQSSFTRGLCLKDCRQPSECPTDSFCGKVYDFETREAVGACRKVVTQEGQSCKIPLLCGSGLVCVGSGANYRCRKGCLNTPCSNNYECVQYKDPLGNVTKAACRPYVKNRALCDSTNRCKKGSVCAAFRSKRRTAFCLQDCTKDPKVCGKQQQCTPIGSRYKFCYDLISKEGESCAGPANCSKGLRCFNANSDAARYCMKDCSKDPNICNSQQICHSFSSTLSGCVPKCTANSSCSWKGFQCQKSKGKSERCLADPKSYAGIQSIGKECQTHPNAPASTKCAKELQCTQGKNGWSCLKPCDLKTPNCPSSQQCLYLSEQKAFFCGKPQIFGAKCNVNQSLFCKKGSQCISKTNTTDGICEPYKVSKAGNFCDPKILPCEEKSICAGDPASPFRWQCKQQCSPQSTTSCPNTQTCLPLGSGGACFQTCTNDKSCQTKGFQCKTAKQKKVCL